MKLTLPMPPAINRMYKTTRSGGFYKSSVAKDWEDEAMQVLMVERFKSAMITEPVKLTLHFYFKRDRDIDSSLKGLLDFLQKKIIKNDSLVEELHVYKTKGSLDPRVEIELEDLAL